MLPYTCIEKFLRGFATYLKSPKIHTVKNRYYYKTPLRTLFIPKNVSAKKYHIFPSVIFLPNFQDAKNSRYTVYRIYKIEVNFMQFCASVTFLLIDR